MEDQVPFKVYTYLNGGGSKPEVRRFGVDRNVVTSFTYLLAKINDVFPNLKDKMFSISWKDEEGDDVKISSDEEIMTMLTAAPSQLFKLYVHVTNNAEGMNQHVINVSLAAPQHASRTYIVPGHPGLHAGVRCDSCQHGVVGFRYKCITCEDFDLCSRCEAHGAHSDHCFVRIPSPHMSLQVVKDSIRKSRYFLKTFASSLHEAQKKQRAEMKKTASTPAAAPTGGCPMMNAQFSTKVDAKLAAKERREERREERQEKRQEKHEKRQERREEERRERRENPHERVGWMDIFSKYVDQFANLAADHIRVAAGETSEQTSQTNENTDAYLHPTEFAEMMSACMKLRDVAEMYGQDDGSQETSQVSKEGSSEKPTSVPSTSQTAAQQPPTFPQVPTTPQFTTTSQVPTQIPITPQVVTHVPATPQVPTTAAIAPQVVKPVEDSKVDTRSDSGSTSNESTSRGTSPDKSPEDWTMINNEKDLDPDTGAVNLMQVDSNLPEEFQPRPGGTYGFIYPPLNASTAVYNPQEPAVPAKAEPAPTPVAPTQPQAQQTQGFNTGSPQMGNGTSIHFSKLIANMGQSPYVGYMGQAGQARPAQAAPSARPAQAAPPAKPTLATASRPSAPVVEERQHRVPHIDAAIRQMIAMGFTNEGGWLTQLVESKDGNIAAVLDLLTPVNPRKK